MDKVTYNANNQRKIERFLLIIYTMYSVGMMLFFANHEKAGLINFLLLFLVMTDWLIHLAGVNTYSFRVKISSVLMQISVVIYAVNTESLAQVYAVFATFIILLGLYGIQEIIFITTVSFILILGYHTFSLFAFASESANDVMSILLQSGNVILLEYIMYIWTKRNNDGSNRLVAAVEELEMAEESKNDFLANVSHEIRTPINTICGMSELVLREELPENVTEKIKDIERSGHDLMMVVSDILDFSELQSGKIELEEEAYNIASTINDVINVAMSRKKDKKIELIVDCDANMPSGLLGDEKKLRRVIMNLVDNAIKFTEEGCVSLEIGYRKETYGINLAVTVKDTGIGMNEQSLEKMFVSFNQADAKRNRHEGGVGLGLAISHALVQKMGGAITVKSKPGKGSAIKFVVPQKVLDETPIASIQNKENINVATYIDMEQFDMMAIRDEYTDNIIHMVEQLKAKCQICRNLQELQRREEKEKFSHVFISVVEYKEGKEYFDELANETNVIVVLDDYDEKYVTNPQLLKVYKPFYILTILSVINNLESSGKDRRRKMGEKFMVKNARVLVVDDNHTNIRVIEGLLNWYGIEVTTAESGKEALEKIMTADYDFVFMDHMMPEMDGVETLHQIRTKVGTYFQNVPIVVLTANAVAGTRETLLSEGFDDFLEKPVERSVLERVLKRNLPAEKIVYVKEQESTTYAENLEKDGKENEDVEKALMDLGFDVVKGILYCNGKEQYIRVLTEYCKDYKKSGLKVDRLHEQQDWNSYVIEVHGIKSAMYSIGALKTSELAKQLELAGREGNWEFIEKNHGPFVEKYEDVLEKLCRLLLSDEELQTEQEKESEAVADITVMPDLTDDEFKKKLEEMENAVYALDGQRLAEVIETLQEYQYHGTSLRGRLADAYRKVEMCDYMAAVELVSRIRKKLAGEEK
ncbi:MAG: response regulator [Lachnospiraceae bacterium]|nr:response regulator [Lachnospiraceae bacterium]